ncbi:hypothetical protein Q8W32_03305 [Oceanobacter sp. 3_MG-2023]|nr:hypothetical protein [Oceanobacter sp. 3_MG-2023]
MMILAALCLLAAALVSSWQNRPATSRQWPGSAAGRFTAGLILVGYGITSLLTAWRTSDGVQHTALLMQQLSLYAALPMLVSSHLAERLGYNWNRQIWGRIFLGWCVVFELTRRSNVLEWVLIATLIIGLVTLLLPWILSALRQTDLTDGGKRSWQRAYFPVIAWLLLCSGQATQSTTDPVVQMAGLTLALIALHNAQPLSYQMAKRGSDNKATPS